MNDCASLTRCVPAARNGNRSSEGGRQRGSSSKSSPCQESPGQRFSLTLVNGGVKRAREYFSGLGLRLTRCFCSNKLSAWRPRHSRRIHARLPGRQAGNVLLFLRKKKVFRLISEKKERKLTLLKALLLNTKPAKPVTHRLLQKSKRPPNETI